MPDESLTEIGISEREKGRFSELDELVFACWSNNAEIEIDVDLVLEQDDVCIGLDFTVSEWVTGWEEKVDGFLLTFQIHIVEYHQQKS